MWGYGDARTPNWSHKHHTLCLGAYIGGKGERFEACNLSTPTSPLLIRWCNYTLTL